MLRRLLLKVGLLMVRVKVRRLRKDELLGLKGRLRGCLRSPVFGVKGLIV